MTIGKSFRDGVMTLTLSGWLDTQSAPDLESALSEMNPEAKELVLDLTGLEYISSAGIRQIVSAHKKMNGALTLKNVSGEVMDVLDMTGVSKRLNITR